MVSDMSHEGTKNDLWQIYQFFNSKRVKEATFIAKGHLRKVKTWGSVKGVKLDQGQIINLAKFVIYSGILLVFRFI